MGLGSPFSMELTAAYTIHDEEHELLKNQILRRDKEIYVLLFTAASVVPLHRQHT